MNCSVFEIHIASPLHDKVVPLSTGESLRIGSDPSSEIHLEGQGVASAHARIEVFDDSLHILDLRSEAGLYVNDKRIDQAYIGHGDRIRVGEFELSITAQNNVDDFPTTDFRMEPQEVESVGNWELLQRIGQGGMGKVYLARNLTNGKQCALKVITQVVSGEETVQRELFEREGRVLARLTHPHLTQFIESGIEDGHVYLAMEYVETIPFLNSLAQQEFPQRIRLAVGITCQVLSALDYVHRESIIHRDVKPANVLTFLHKGKVAAKLADFGLAKNYVTSTMNLTQDGSFAGSLLYIPPEQLTDYAAAEPRSDLYGTAATLYHWLCGHAPHTDSRGEPFPIGDVLEQNISILPLQEREPRIPKPLAELVHRSLLADPRKRFVSADHMRNALLPFTKKKQLREFFR